MGRDLAGGGGRLSNVSNNLSYRLRSDNKKRKQTWKEKYPFWYMVIPYPVWEVLIFLFSCLVIYGFVKLLLRLLPQ